MGRKFTPPPEPPELKGQIGCALSIVVPSVVLAVAAIWSGWYALLVLCIPALLIIGRWLLGKWLLLRAFIAYRRRKIVGVLVTSDSPNRNEYMTQKWLEPYPGRFDVLNWSEKKNWGFTHASDLYFRFCHSDKNFCPAVILLRGLRYPLVFRFYYALRDHRHGNNQALNMLEERLTRELEK